MTLIADLCARLCHPAAWGVRLAAMVAHDSRGVTVRRLTVPLMCHRPVLAGTCGRFACDGTNDRLEKAGTPAYMFLFFSNRVGCLGSLVISFALTALLLFLLGVL